MHLLLVAIVVSTASLATAQGDDDLFPWWHGLDDHSSRILEADCLRYSGGRPRATLIRQEMIDQNTGTPLSRHHIIPGSTLSLFFNTALQENGNNNTQLAGLLNVLGYLADTALDYYVGNDQIHEEVREQLSTIRTTQLHYENGIEVPLGDLFNANELARAMFYWMPGNIFIGPRHRTDDPGDSFENNARFIIQDNAAFQTLSSINRTMNLYIQNRNVTDFNSVIDMLETFVVIGRHEPYPYNPAQWLASRLDYIGNTLTQFYRINTNPPVRRYFMKRDAQTTSFKKDPLCLLPGIMYGLSLKKDNLIIAATIIERTERGSGFAQKFSYGSWRQWLERSSWESGYISSGIAPYGMSMVRDNYGYLFNDHSFVIGVIGADQSFGNDSWTVSPQWDASRMSGQMFFDKNGRPVALAVSDESKTKNDKGWLFVYTLKKWKSVPSFDIAATLSSLFPNGQTESLDGTAMRFTPHKLKLTHDNGREFRSTHDN